MKENKHIEHYELFGKRNGVFGEFSFQAHFYTDNKKFVKCVLEVIDFENALGLQENTVHNWLSDIKSFSGLSKCDAEDTFDAFAGQEIAMDRAFNKFQKYYVSLMVKKANQVARETEKAKDILFKKLEKVKRKKQQ